MHCKVLSLQVQPQLSHTVRSVKSEQVGAEPEHDALLDTMHPVWVEQRESSLNSSQSLAIPTHPLPQSASVQQLPPARHDPPQQMPPVHTVWSGMAGLRQEEVSSQRSRVQGFPSLQSESAAHSTQTPLEQRSMSAGQAFPHPPQQSRRLSVSQQPTLQHVSPSGQGSSLHAQGTSHSLSSQSTTPSQSSSFPSSQ